MQGLRRWCSFSFAPHGIFITATLYSFFDLVFGVLILLAVIKHFRVIRISKHLSAITKQNDPPVLAAKSSASVVKIKFVFIGTITLELVPDSWSPKFGCRNR